MGQARHREADQGGAAEGKEHRHPEMYYEGVLPGARLIADECSKDVIFE